MIMLTSLAALALGAAPVQTQTPAPAQGATGPVQAAVATQGAPSSATKPVGKPGKPESTTDVAKPAVESPAPPKP